MTVRKVPGRLPVGFRYTPGVANTAFFDALRDRGVLLGSRCESCGVTYLPARLFCERCFGELAADVECGPEGTLESWSVSHVDVDGRRLDAPVRLGLARMDGADTVLLHLLLDSSEPRIGMRVRAVFRDDRAGSIDDLRGFAPVEAG
jgi:uncharacterized OB-fold protein